MFPYIIPKPFTVKLRNMGKCSYIALMNESISAQKLSDTLAAAMATSSSDNGSLEIPAALFVIQLMPHTLKPQ